MSKAKNKFFEEHSLLNSMIVIFLLAIFLLPGIFLYQQYLLPLQEEKAREEAARLAANQLKMQEILAKKQETAIVDGIHVATGLVADEHYQLVVSNCTSCHSSKLIIQNRASREDWKNMIVWMQQTQNLWDLGENEAPILEYLSKNYAPEFKGRRATLTNVEWYELKE